jgi:hypothetical protein
VFDRDLTLEIVLCFEDPSLEVDLVLSFGDPSFEVDLVLLLLKDPSW